MVEGLVDKKIKANGVQPGLGCLCLSVIFIGTSNVNLGDPRTRGDRGRSGSRGGGGWFDMVMATGDGVLSWQKRMRGKARPFVKDARVLLYLLQ